MIWTRVLWAALALMLGAVPDGAGRAADESPVPLEPLAPVLYVIGPVSGPACGGVGLVALLAPAGLGDNASTILRAAAPVFTLCGAIPPTPVEDRYSCSLDRQALEVIGAVTGLAGVPPAVDVRPVGQVLEQLGAAGSVLLTKPRMNELLKQPSVVLQCTQGVPPASEPVVPPDGVEPEPAPEPAPMQDPPPLLSLGDGQLPLPTPGAGPSPVVSPEVPVAVTTPFGRVPFSYAAVFVLPFLVLVVMGVIGSGLLRPLPLDPESTTVGGFRGHRHS